MIIFWIFFAKLLLCKSCKMDSEYKYCKPTEWKWIYTARWSTIVLYFVVNFMTTTVEQCSHRRPWSTCSWSYWLYTRGREDYLLTSGQKGQRSRLLLELQVLIVTLKSPFLCINLENIFFFLTCVSYGQTWSDSEAAIRFWFKMKIRSGWFIENQWGGGGG